MTNEEFKNKYDLPLLDPDYEDYDNTMSKNVEDFTDEIVGHRIVSVERETTMSTPHPFYPNNMMPYDVDVAFTLDNGTRVGLVAGGDCCAYTELEDIIEHLPSVDHIITAVRPDEDYDTWHILADFGEVMELKVGWSPGNIGYYGYGFDVVVEKP